MRKFVATLFLLVITLSASAGGADSLGRKSKSRYPAFGTWKNNYFTTGFATNAPVNKNTADIKFQVSIAVRLWSIKEKVDIFATYSQRSIWDAFRESSPFRESAYNPALWVIWQVQDDMRLLFGIEHESNGYGDQRSRSQNVASVACLYEPFNHWRFGGRIWGGYAYIEEDVVFAKYFQYRGLMQLWGTFHAFDERLQVTALVNPTLSFTKYNLQLEASWRLAKRKDWLPSLFVQYCYGYGETMADYDRRSSKIRFGISFTNNNLNLY